MCEKTGPVEPTAGFEFPTGLFGLLFFVGVAGDWAYYLQLIVELAKMYAQPVVCSVIVPEVA